VLEIGSLNEGKNDKKYCERKERMKSLGKNEWKTRGRRRWRYCGVDIALLPQQYQDNGSSSGGGGSSGKVAMEALGVLDIQSRQPSPDGVQNTER
jgi:hypothetical protein